MKVTATQLTVRGLPIEVDRVLRARAKAAKKSINQLIVEELTKATIGQPKLADFSDLVGRWQPDSAFAHALEEQRRVNPEDWQ